MAKHMKTYKFPAPPEYYPKCKELSRFARRVLHLTDVSCLWQKTQDFDEELHGTRLRMSIAESTVSIRVCWLSGVFSKRELYQLFGEKLRGDLSCSNLQDTM